MKKLTTIIIVLTIIPLVYGQGQQGSFVFDLTTTSIQTVVCTTYDLEVVLGNSGEVDISEPAIWVLFKDYGNGLDEAYVWNIPTIPGTEQAVNFDYEVYDADGGSTTSGTGTGYVFRVVVGENIMTQFPAGTYGAFKALFPSGLVLPGTPEGTDEGGESRITIEIPIHSDQPGTVLFFAYAYGKDPSGSPVHNSLEKDGTTGADSWELSNDEIPERSPGGIAKIIVEDIQIPSNVPVMPPIAVPIGSIIVGSICWSRRRK